MKSEKEWLERAMKTVSQKAKKSIIVIKYIDSLPQEFSASRYQIAAYSDISATTCRDVLEHLVSYGLIQKTSGRITGTYNNYKKI